MLQPTADCFRFYFAYAGLHALRTGKLEARCGPVKGPPREYPGARGVRAGPADRCQVPAMRQHRRYLPAEVFLGRRSHLMIRKPVLPADGRG
jgi:hypothetical protein